MSAKSRIAKIFEIFWIIITAFFCASDIITTYIGLSAGGVEINPLPALFISKFGIEIGVIVCGILMKTVVMIGFIILFNIRISKFVTELPKSGRLTINIAIYTGAMIFLLGHIVATIHNYFELIA